MALTLEQKAWQIHEHGVSYGELATTANILEISMNEAIELLWDEKVAKKQVFNTENVTNL